MTTSAKPGDKIADVPHLMAMWDYSKNDGLDPATIAAQANRSIDWVCTKHEAGDPDGKWPGHLHQWSQPANQRAMRNPGCRFCMRRQACPATCLRTSHPKFARADEWDYETNDPTGVTPDNKLSGSKVEVSWICKRHGNYSMAIIYRTMLGQGCKSCALQAADEKRRKTKREKAKSQHLLAIQGRERRNTENDGSPT